MLHAFQHQEVQDHWPETISGLLLPHDDLYGLQHHAWWHVLLNLCVGWLAVRTEDARLFCLVRGEIRMRSGSSHHVVPWGAEGNDNNEVREQPSGKVPYLFHPIHNWRHVVLLVGLCRVLEHLHADVPAQYWTLYHTFCGTRGCGWAPQNLLRVPALRQLHLQCVPCWADSGSQVISNRL